jgi:triacylglycerol lipase
MNNVIAQSASEVETVNKLLSKPVPTYRQAYSDRTCWLMACLSELAYLRFNPLFTNLQQQKLVVKYLEEFDQKSKKSSLMKLIDLVAYDHQSEIEKLNSSLSALNAELVTTFDANGTQAILVSTDKFIALAFRGTEATSIKDIKADAKANTVKCDSGGMIHTGFKLAFEDVAIDIQSKLDQAEFKDKPLFITGHSLGGALATIAAKKLSHGGGISACYTFGSPRVGDEVWISNIKTPLYRVVNAADCVTMMPPSSETITLASWLLGFIPQFGKSIRSYLLTKFGGYLHGGNMRYLTNCTAGDYDAVNLLYSVSFFYRIKMLYVKALPWSKPLADHSISIYRKKLASVATNRN